MLNVVIFVAVVIALVNAAAFTDLNCTNMDAANSKFVESATNCNNKYSTTICATLFGVAVVDLGAVDRDVKCNAQCERKLPIEKDAAGRNEQLKELAISTCAKHCGYCCESPEFKCDNKPIPRVKCETVTQNQCTDPIWRQILAEDCPKSCGLCLAGGCVDKVVDCANDPAICRNVDLQIFVKENCQRTCGFCAPGGNGTCADATNSCTAWAAKGFCTSTFYGEALRRQYCAKTCNLC